MRFHLIICAGLATAALGLGSSNAAVIDFETGPSPQMDNADVTDQFDTPAFDNVEFSSGGQPAKLEAVGGGDADPQGFLNDPINTNDVATSGTPGLGDWFLRSRGDTGISQRGPGDSFLKIEYGSDVFEASGQIWDIDGNDSLGSEKWNVRALDAAGNVLAVEMSPEFQKGTNANSLNGQPYNFTFDLPERGDPIAEINFEFAGTKENGIGLAFDNFNSSGTSIPAPGTLALLGIGLAGAGLLMRRNGNAA